jgi:hypothetical protein
MPNEHRATVVPVSLSPEDTHLTLMVECFECPQNPLRWGFMKDSPENLEFLEAEALRHNGDFASERFDSSSETSGTMNSTTDESGMQ